jgi:hypothetical protein
VPVGQKPKSRSAPTPGAATRAWVVSPCFFGLRSSDFFLISVLRPSDFERGNFCKRLYLASGRSHRDQYSWIDRSACNRSG